jgi:hypothetical protein
MKKPLLIVIIILVVILFLPVISLISWTFQTKKPMDIVILDKTVPTLDREKHRSLDWVLTNERFVKKGNKFSYSYRKDYYGFFPKRPLREKLYDKKEYRLADLIVLADKSDALYYADTYGVFFNDWYKGINKSRRSRRLYGGLNNNDYLLLSEMRKRNKLVVLEYNTFDYPTADLERYKTEEQLGVKFSKWTGKYFSSLDTTSSEDFPIWMTAMFRKEYRKPWTFKKEGVVLIKEKDIIVLEEGTHLKNGKLYIMTDSANCKKYGVINKVPFEGWFDIIDPQVNKVVSKFNLQTNSVGDTLLYENFLTNEFPAVITDTVNQRTYYFSGDFATNIIPFWTSRFQGVEKLKGILYSDKVDDPRRFFWLYYRPLINGIFSDYNKTVKAAK